MQPTGIGWSPVECPSSERWVLELLLVQERVQNKDISLDPTGHTMYQPSLQLISRDMSRFFNFTLKGFYPYLS